MIRVICSAFLASLGFGILFNIKGKKLILAGIAGSIGTLSYTIALHAGIGQMMSMFIGSIVLSAFSEIAARMIKTPVTTFIICALIPLVPGGGMYQTMLAGIQGNADEMIQLLLKTITDAGALAMGIIFVSAVVKATLMQHKDIKGE